MKRAYALIVMLVLSACSDPPEFCKNACKPFGGAGWWDVNKEEWVVRCNDDAFFNSDSPEKCSPHRGVKARTNIGSRGIICHCGDGSLMGDGK